MYILFIFKQYIRFIETLFISSILLQLLKNKKHLPFDADYVAPIKELVE